MSAPYGAPQQAPQQSPSRGQKTGGTNPASLLPLVAAGLGLVGYFAGFGSGPVNNSSSGVALFGLIGAAVLAGLWSLPKAPNTLYAAAPLAACAALGQLQSAITGGGGGIIVLVIAFLQLGAIVGALLIEAGVVSAPGRKSEDSKWPDSPRSGPFPQPAQSGPYSPFQPGSWTPQGQPQPGQPGGWSPSSGPQAQPHQPQPAPAPQGQPIGWTPASGGFAITPAQQPTQQGEQQQQQAGQQMSGQLAETQQSSQEQPNDPQGTQQMRHPGASSSSD